jgi:hypothetical protein
VEGWSDSAGSALSASGLKKFISGHARLMHPERIEESHPLENTRFFASLSMTLSSRTSFCLSRASL